MGSVSLNSVSVTHSRIFHILFFAIFVALSFLNIFFSHLFEIATLANLCWILDIWMIHQQNIRTIKLNAQFLLSVLFEFSNLKCYVISESLFHSDLYSCWQIRIWISISFFHMFFFSFRLNCNYLLRMFCNQIQKCYSTNSFGGCFVFFLFYLVHLIRTVDAIFTEYYFHFNRLYIHLHKYENENVNWFGFCSKLNRIFK